MATRLILLGTGTPSFREGRVQQASVVEAQGRPYLVDCGGGALQRYVEAYGPGGKSLKALDRVFLTHLHPDHTAGLADLLIAPWVLGRSQPLRVFGPAGTRAMIDALLTAYALGIDEHRNGAAGVDYDLVVDVVECKDVGEIYRDDVVAVEAFGVTHGGLDAFGFRFTADDKVIVISGDTAPNDSVIRYAKACDILVHEAISMPSFEAHFAGEVKDKWRGYHQSVHTTTSALARIAQETRPGLLVLTHVLWWGDTTEQSILDEIAQTYDGPVAFGRDLSVFE